MCTALQFQGRRTAAKGPLRALQARCERARRRARRSFRSRSAISAILRASPPVEEPVEGGFSDEMLVLCGLSGPQLDALLSSLRRSRVVVALKAVVTEDKPAWSSLQLHDELRQEHEAMKGHAAPRMPKNAPRTANNPCNRAEQAV